MSPADAGLGALWARAVRWRNRRWDRPDAATRVPAPVISVGNLVVGGVGKTPLVAWLAERLRDRGRRPAIVSRGYGGSAGKGPVWVSSGTGAEVEPGVSGDEPAWFAETLPGVAVVVGSDRVAGARAAVGRGADAILLDDGFQHRRLARDLDLLVWDAREAPGESRMLPHGRLREPLDSAARADVLVVTHSDARDADVEAVARAFPALPRFLAVHRPSAPRRFDEGGAGPPPSHAVAFCGIAKPEGFRRTLESLGIEVVEWSAFRDHHRYRDTELRRLAARAVARDTPLVTTEKDAARLRGRRLPSAPGWWSVGVRLAIDDGERLLELAVTCGTDA